MVMLVLQGELQAMQLEIRTATFATVRAAEEQSAALKRLMDQSRLDTSKTHEMLAQVCICDASICRRCLTQVVGVISCQYCPECEACWHAHKLCQLPRQHLTACQLDVIAPRKGICLQSEQG